MGDFYDPEHPTEEEGGDAKVEERISKSTAVIKGLPPPKSVGSNRLLPRGTKSKVNLEEQGRQKVSFSFSQTKKPLQNVFLAPLSPENPPSDPQFSFLSAVHSPPQQRTEPTAENRNELIELPVAASVAEPTSSLTSPSKSKLDLGKMHFKKQLLNVSTGFEQQMEKESTPSIMLETLSSLGEAEVRTTVRLETQATSHAQHIVNESTTEELKGFSDTSHIGREDREKASGAEHTDILENRKSQSQSDSTLPGSESDGDSVRTSSSYRSGEPRVTAKVDGQNKDAKRNSACYKTEELEKSNVRSDERVKDERSSTHPKSDREMRHTSSRSSRSDKDRRRTKSRSRSRSRGSRTSSSYSRSERSSRNERSSRSDRSRYHESERRSHRSPHRERRTSRSRTDRRSRDSSDSEDDYWRARTRTNRSSNHSSSHRDSKTVYTKSERDSRSTEVSRSSESEKKTQVYPERCSRKTDCESVKRSSPELEPDRWKPHTHNKMETTPKSTHCKSVVSSQSSDKRTVRNSSSDSEGDQKRTPVQVLSKLSFSSGLVESQATLTEKADSLSSSKLIVTPGTRCHVTHGFSRDIALSSMDCVQNKNIDLSKNAVSQGFPKEINHLTVPEHSSSDGSVGQVCDQTNSSSIVMCGRETLVSGYALCSESKPQKLDSSPSHNFPSLHVELAPQCQLSQSLGQSNLPTVPDTYTSCSETGGSSETFRCEQIKDGGCPVSHTDSDSSAMVREGEDGPQSEAHNTSSSLVLSCKPCPKDYYLSGTLEESLNLMSSKGSCTSSGVTFLAESEIVSASNTNSQLSDEVANGLSTNKQGNGAVCEGECCAQPLHQISESPEKTSTADIPSSGMCVVPSSTPPQIGQNPNVYKNFIPVNELPFGDNLQQNTKSGDVVSNPSEVSSQSSVVPPKLESVIKVTEHSAADMKYGQQGPEVLKNKSSMKKSRWDIVGQEVGANETSQKMPVYESKSLVKKIISVKKIEFSKESSTEDGLKKESKNVGLVRIDVNKDTLPTEHQFKKNEGVISNEDRSLTKSCEKIKLTEQMQPLKTFAQSQACDTSNTKTDIKSHGDMSNKLLLKRFVSGSGDEARVKDSHGDSIRDYQHDSHLQSKPERNSVCIGRDLGGRTDDSDSDSECDSDDSSIPKNRLHSVVVVPKNSTLTHPHDSRAMLASSSSPSNSPRQLSADSQEHCWRGTRSQEADRGEDTCREVPGTLSPTGRQRGYPDWLPESSKRCLDVLCTDKSLFTTPQSMAYQSQSNMVDSTSHVETSRTLEVQQSKDLKSNAYETPKIPATHNSMGPFYSQENSWRISDPAHSRLYDRPDSWHDRKRYVRHQQEGDFSGSGSFSKKDTYSMNWDFSQCEQPSSTFQLPDSSYGVQAPNPPIVGNPVLGLVVQQGACWSQPTTSQSCRPVYLPVPSQYHETLDEVHPDSLTNDCEEESPRSRITMGLGSHPPPASTSFVQAHEISSNCRGLMGGILDIPREESQKPHRGRGPPKKRRPEFESDSESEAEPGNCSKRERLKEAAVTRTSKDPAETPNQTTEVERPPLSLKDFLEPVAWKEMAKLKKMPPYFDLIEENMYLTERKKNKSHRDIKRMQCECTMLSREERARGATACGDDCLNRLLMIECSSRCLNGPYCSNRRFQLKQHTDFEVILTESKGWGLRAAKDLAPNTFVLEYCGEVLDHKEFKARVKEYARSKNIHYYFMALKNNEIIDATLKGNCSRFMNHSCEPNCETQKWTVNGQLRVGFFTTKAVPSGTELTFDYQFQRYGKEAQKCLCGAPSCRGFLGGENRVSIRAAGGKMKKERTRKKDSVSALTTVDEELEALLENGEGLTDEKEVLSLCRLMVRVETMEQKLICLKLIQNTQNPGCLKQFLDHHGLSLLWIFMVELSEGKGNSGNNIKLQLEIMKSLEVLPISTKNMLEESRVLHFIQRWAQSQALPQAPELDGYSSENTSRAQTPLNTPDGPPAKQGPELDSDTPKRTVYRRLKIISENSLDSALSDASKASDGKEDDEEEDEEEEDDSLPTEIAVSDQAGTEAVGEPQAEEEEPAASKQEVSEDLAGSEVEVKAKVVEASQPEEESTEGPSRSEEGSDQDGDAEGAPQVAAEVEASSENETLTVEEPPRLEDAQVPAEEEASSVMEVVVSEPVEEAPPITAVEAETTESAHAAATEPPGSSAVDMAEPTGSSVPVATGPVAAESVAVETPSQDEEEAVSDVESERSQEPPVRAADVSDMASRLLDSWKELKEVYRIPKKSQVEKEPKERSWERDGPQATRTSSGSRDRDRERDLERTPRSTERRRRRPSLSPPPSAYERSSRRAGDDRYSNLNGSKKGRTKERNKLSTEERRKLFEQEVAQKEAQKQQQLQTMAYETLGYSPSPHGFMGYPPGYPMQTYVDPTNPNAGKVLLPTPAVEPLCASAGTVPYEQTPPQPLISELALTSPAPTQASQAPAVAGVQHVAAPPSLELPPGGAQYVQPRPASQDPAAVAVLPVAVPSAAAGVPGQAQQGYTPLWNASVPQPLPVQAQPPQQYPASAQPQTAVYYQGQTVYSIPAAYPQAGTPVIQAYAEPATGYLQGQPVYSSHQQGVVLQQAGTVTTIVTAPAVQQELMAPNSLMDLPPPSPPKPKTIVLPPSWKVARDSEGKIYYYHVITRQTQWDPPCWEGGSEDTSVEHEAEMDLGTPTYDENPSKFSTKTAEADTSSELAKKSKEVFRKEMSQFIVQCLNPYRKPDCKLGRISNTDDFKHLARKLTHGVMNKELKSCKNPEDLECNENVKHKTKEYIKKYMQKFGPLYKPKEDTEVD
ncbi:histone-lysine N-methyltransferase SETD2 isoform X2 [Brienomyrus brachyistius]|uniref:histone-lysine N-methyltransferase SETD2 isoform X2 n=1 Tax=Brienomyrus brachyistius TaxID=42636 RepID=UPI0020B387D0|nr:histone-lysine N-methyltransferase SETD2 isoform X2 [Brienomyrus brachyistius]